ncbi:MAG: hypothetical protein Q9219_003659 [cf. Caloplaca sp. 3 TL-2023]
MASNHKTTFLPLLPLPTAPLPALPLEAKAPAPPSSPHHASQLYGEFSWPSLNVANLTSKLEDVALSYSKTPAGSYDLDKSGFEDGRSLTFGPPEKAFTVESDSAEAKGLSEEGMRASPLDDSGKPDCNLGSESITADTAPVLGFDPVHAKDGHADPGNADALLAVYQSFVRCDLGCEQKLSDLWIVGTLCNHEEEVVEMERDLTRLLIKRTLWKYILERWESDLGIADEKWSEDRLLEEVEGWLRFRKEKYES